MKGFDDVDPISGQEWSRPLVKDDKTKLIESYLLGALNTPCISSYKPQIRVSSLPMCGLLYAQALLKYKKGERKEEQLKDTFYTDVGTAIHTFFQGLLPKSAVKDRIFGNWKCNKCNKITHTLCTTPKSLICSYCKTNTIIYDEIEVEYKGITGHIDTILKNEDDTYTILDYKTTSTYNIKEPKYLPQNKHLHQIESYCYMIQNQYDICISNYALAYLSRDKCDGGTSKLENTRIIAFDVTKNTLSRRKNQLDKLAKSSKLIKSLFANPTSEKLKELDNNRPCKTIHDFENSRTGMKASFFGSEVCPYLESCCGKKKYTKAAKDLWNMIE